MRRGLILISALGVLGLSAAVTSFWALQNTSAQQGYSPSLARNPDPSGWPQLYRAAFEGDLERVNALLSSGAAVDERNPKVNGSTALMAAALGGYYEVAQALIEKGANPNARNDFNGTAFILAARNSVKFESRRKRWSRAGVSLADSGYGYVALMDYLISKGANPRAVSRSGRSALDVPVLAGNESIARYVVSTGVRPTGRDKRFWRRSTEGLSPYQIETFRKKEGLDTFHPDETTRLAALVEELADEAGIAAMPKPEAPEEVPNAKEPESPEAAPTSSKAKPASATPADQVANCAKLLAANKVCEKLPFPFNTGCKITAQANYGNKVCKVK